MAASEDKLKQKLLELLAKEPPMLVYLAYAYAKNYVLYGEDITKEWTTAVQHEAIIEKVRNIAYAEGYESFKKDYESRLNNKKEV